MDALYLAPTEQVIDEPNFLNARGPKYFNWAFDPDPPGIQCFWAMMDYGFMPTMLVFARGITPTDHDYLSLQADVYVWPDNLDQSINPQDAVKTFLEGINVPTDWTTAATTYRQLLRSLAGMFQFMQRYGGISGGQALLGGSVTLSTRYRNLSAQQQGWFSQTVESFGYDPTMINANRTMRQMLKLAGDAWGATVLYGRDGVLNDAASTSTFSIEVKPERWKRTGNITGGFLVVYSNQVMGKTATIPYFDAWTADVAIDGSICAVRIRNQPWIQTEFGPGTEFVDWPRYETYPNGYTPSG